MRRCCREARSWRRVALLASTRSSSASLASATLPAVALHIHTTLLHMLTLILHQVLQHCVQCCDSYSYDWEARHSSKPFTLLLTVIEAAVQVWQREELSEWRMHLKVLQGTNYKQMKLQDVFHSCHCTAGRLVKPIPLNSRAFLSAMQLQP